MTDDTHDYKPDKVYHPSETLREWISKNAPIQGRAPAVQLVMEGEDVDDTIAFGLELATGVNASFWLNLQRKYDEVHGDD